MNCPACGTDNVPGAPTCARCGAALAGPAAPGGRPPAGGPAAGEWAPPAPGGSGSGEWGPPGPAQPSAGWATPAGGQPAGEWAPPPGGEYGAAGPQTPSGPGWEPPPQGAYPPPAGGYGQPGAGGFGQPPSGDQWGPAPGASGYGAPPKKGTTRRNLLVVLGLLVVVALGAGAFALTAVGGEEEASDEVVLEPIGTVQEDDFAGNLDLENVSSGVGQALAAEPGFGEAQTASLAARSAAGTEPGLYGGSRDTAVCDVDQLVNVLTDPANEDKAAAWTGVLGIGVSDIESYVGGLTSVRLRFDTRVTNHGFSDGEANPFQSVLQAGTAVLVDGEGVPRAKCNCGNPLLAPAALDDESRSVDIDEVAQNPDDAWEGLDPAGIVAVEPGTATDSFTLVSNDDGELYSRPVRGNGDTDAPLEDFAGLCERFSESPTCGGNIDLGTGDVQITLQWASSADLDLHVTEPDGTELYFGNTGPSPSQGQLDVDSNVGCEPDGSVENVFWPTDSPPPAGDYTVEVNGYDVGATGGESCGDGAYILTIKVAGEEDQIYEETVADDETDTYPLTIPG